MKKLIISSIVALLFLSCSVSAPDTSSPLSRRIQYAPTGHSSLNFSDLEKEYSSFSTKALSDAYVSRMFTKFLTTSPNPTQVIRQLEFARYLKDVKSDSSYFNSLKNIIAVDNEIFTKIDTTSGVPAKKTSEPATFGVFLDSLNPNPSNFPTSGLVSFYLADNTPNDSLGVNNLTLENGVSYSAGKINNAFDFDGVDDYTYVNKNSTLDLTTNMSISLWFNARSVSNTPFLISKAPLNNYSAYGLYFYGGTNQIGLESRTTTNGSDELKQDINLDVSFNLNTWNNVVFTFNNGVCKLYKNGILASTKTTAGTAFRTDGTAPLVIGAWVNGTQHFNGNLDMIGLWNRDLTPAEVTALYNNGSGLQYPYTSPETLSTTSVTSSGFTANWGAVNGATSYDLLVTKVSDNSIVFNQNIGNVITSPVTGLNSATTYSWKVRANWGSQSSSYTSNQFVLTGSGIVPLLDIYPGASVSYSLRRLKSSYSGSAVRVRRSSDNAEQDIGFVNNTLDTAALSTFVGSGNGYISSWYDQSGNARNATQSTTANQPILVSFGTVLTNLNNPSIKFESGTFQSLANSSFNLPQPNSAYAVAKYDGGSGQQYLFDSANGSQRNAVFRNQGQGKWDLFAGSEVWGTTTVAGNYLFEGYFNNSSSKLYLNTTLSASGNAGGMSMNGIRIAQWNISTNSSIHEWGSFINEIVIYNSDQLTNRAGIETNINAYYSIY